MDTLPVCQAKSKQSGKQCRNFAVKHRFVCHIHGGKTPLHNPGPKTKEGKMRQKMSNWKHGLQSKEATAEKRALQDMINDCKNVIDMI
jgi:hypothetical protein